MAKRVYELAKELGISSKVIVEKCQAEGISADVVKNHMSTVSLGLEATVREWFNESGEAEASGPAIATAVETSEKVDLKKARAVPRRARAKRPAKPAESEAPESAPAESAPPAPPEAPRQAPEPSAAPAPAEPAEAPAPEPEPAQPPETEPAEPLAPAANAPEAPPEAPAEEAGDADEAPPSPAAPDRDRVTTPGAPAPMNVPTRPKVVQAGPMLDKKQEIRLSGPKVVRVVEP